MNERIVKVDSNLDQSPLPKIEKKERQTNKRRIKNTDEKTKNQTQISLMVHMENDYKCDKMRAQHCCFEK